LTSVPSTGREKICEKRPLGSSPMAHGTGWGWGAITAGVAFEQYQLDVEQALGVRRRLL